MFGGPHRALFSPAGSGRDLGLGAGRAPLPLIVLGVQGDHGVAVAVAGAVPGPLAGFLGAHRLHAGAGHDGLVAGRGAAARGGLAPAAAAGPPG